jgi:glycosyltransferase involved in cell wall biosynthesis
MSPLGETATVQSVAGAGCTPSLSPPFSEPVFLMVNSLERGGTERQFVETARALRSEGVPIHLGCVTKQGPFVQEAGQLSEFPLGGSLYGIQSLRTRWHLRQHLRRRKIAVAHAFDFYANLTLVPAAKLAGTPAVIGSHRQLGDLLTHAQFRAQVEVFKLCDRVVCNSRAAAERLVSAGLSEKKIAVIGNALPAEVFDQVEAFRPRMENKVRIGMIARMNAEYKNHRIFLRAAKRVSERLRAEFVLIGDGPLRGALEREVAELGLSSRVEFWGDRHDIPAVLASLDVSVVPSSSESLSNVMLESMAAGVPVVAAAVGGNIELGSERAVLVRANDEEALAEGMAELVEDIPRRLELAQKSREFAKENFSVGRISRQYQQLYAEVMSERKQSRLLRPTARLRQQKSKVRVAFVAPSLRYIGGQAVQADLLIRNWQGDPDISAGFIAVDPKFPFGLEWAQKVPFLRTIVRQPIYGWKLWRGLKDVDVAHIFSASYTSFLLAPLPAWLTAQILGVKTIINYRSGEARDHLRRSRVARLVLKHADRLIVPSGYLVDVFCKFGLKASIVPNIVDLSQFRFRVRQPFRPHLVCSRGFHPYYRVDLVVYAFAEVQKYFPEARLDLAGGGPVEAEVRELVRKLKLPGVNFLGPVSRKEIGRIYDQADIFVNASSLDNMPVSVLEAFASGTPVATTCPEGMNYIVDHERTGMLSPPGDAASLAQNILRLLKDQELSTRLAANAYEASQRYRWTSVRDLWLNQYRSLLSE